MVVSANSPHRFDDESAGKENHSRKRRASEELTNKPKRRQAACKGCRLRKIKCDRSRPSCNVCKDTGADCEYIEEQTSSAILDPKSGILDKRFDRLEEQIQQLAFAISQRQPSFLTATDRESTHSSVLLRESTYVPEPSRDYSLIPSEPASADAVLQWPIFGSRHPSSYLIRPLFDAYRHYGPEFGNHPGRLPYVTPDSNSAYGLQEREIPALIDNFLTNVHTKNPILDVETLVSKGRAVAKSSLGSDAWSCLILLACALGKVAKPFGSAFNQKVHRSEDDDVHVAHHPRASSEEELADAENYFVTACHCLGTLKPSMIGVQCFFFAGVYLMYTMRPVLSWQYFTQACVLYQVYSKITGSVAAINGMTAESGDCLDERDTRLRERLEQCLYWSCFKSECEFRVELPFAQSEVATYEVENMFPSPPSPFPGDVEISGPEHDEISGSNLFITTSLDTTVGATLDYEDITRHARRLGNEEESWFYYLTELALRRIANRILNSFFVSSKDDWLNITPKLDIALEFEAQITSWSDNLPPAMQHFQTNSSIRAPKVVSLEDRNASAVTRELSWAIDNRLLEARSWLYQPFLYHLVHVRPSVPPSMVRGATLTNGSRQKKPAAHRPARQEVLWGVITRGIECNLAILDSRSLNHRHHGLWYDLRAIMAAGLTLLAVVKSGYGDLIHGGASILWTDDHDQLQGTVMEGSNNTRVGGKIGKVLRQFEIWSAESVDLAQCRELLSETTVEVMQQIQQGS